MSSSAGRLWYRYWIAATGRRSRAAPLTSPIESFELLALALVVRVLCAARHRDLHHHVPRRVERALVEQLPDGADPPVDALRVVEPVDAEEQLLRVPELGAQGRGPGPGCRDRWPVPRRGVVDGDGERADVHPAAIDVDRAATPAHARDLPGQTGEVRRPARDLEADQVGAEQALQDLAPPRELQEQLAGRERDVQEEPDPEVGPSLAQQLRHQLQLVVLHPHRRARRRPFGRGVGEAFVHGPVRVPPRPVVDRGPDGVVVQRPQRRVGEPEIEVVVLVLGDGDVAQRDALVLAGRRLAVARIAGPADPEAVRVAERGHEGGDHAARAGRPDPLAVLLHAPHREAVGDDHEVGAPGGRLRRCGHPRPFPRCRRSETPPVGGDIRCHRATRTHPWYKGGRRNTTG